MREQLLAVGPVDGRYADKTRPLQLITSEHGLIKRRVAVETGWLSMLGSGILPDRPPLDDAAQRTLRALPSTFKVKHSAEVKAIEKTTNHDVKAVETWLKIRLSQDPAFDEYREFVHFGCTSEDINNLAYAMMIRDAREDVLIPGIETVTTDLDSKAEEYADLAMLAHTHGQPASPTTLGKEMLVFAERLRVSASNLGSIAILGKFNGASGNYNADVFAYPEINWPQVSRDFVKRLGFEFNPVTTQIEPHDWMARFSNELSLNNAIMTDLARDLWMYVSMGYLAQKKKEEEVGSSTMPHKVNPIQAENAEGNFGLAIATLDHLAGKLPISRLQRDLSDSSAQRGIGEAFGHTVVSHASIRAALSKVYANPEKIKRDLRSEWGVLMEPVQTVMRRYGIEGAYDTMKEASRGKTLGKQEYLELVEGIEGLPEEERVRLKKLTPAKYIGMAPLIARGLSK